MCWLLLVLSRCVLFVVGCSLVVCLLIVVLHIWLRYVSLSFGDTCLLCVACMLLCAGMCCCALLRYVCGSFFVV